MDFFARQDQARRSTGLLIIQLNIAVVVTILLVYLLPVLCWNIYCSYTSPPNHEFIWTWWYRDTFILICSLTLMTVVTGALCKIMELRRGGGHRVAQLLGGRQLATSTDDFFEKRLQNIVEEMAIASGIPVPPIYVLPREKGINAFAAGFSPTNSIIAVTYGAMTGLARDELQGVIAHEFSHIFNQDMRINIQLMGILHGLLIIGLTGRLLLGFVFDSDNINPKGWPILLLLLLAACTLMLIGFGGHLFCKLIKATISRQRERLADASAVQFTRNPSGLANALKKIGGLSSGSRLCAPHAEQASHMFFGCGLKQSIFHTHPPLAERVRWLEPGFDGRFKPITLDDLHQHLIHLEGAPPKQKNASPGLADHLTRPTDLIQARIAIEATVAGSSSPSRNPDELIAAIGTPDERHTQNARQILAAIPKEIRTHANEPFGARMLIYLLLLDTNEKIRIKQLALIKQNAEPEIVSLLQSTLQQLNPIAPELRLPIIDLTLPALRMMAHSQYLPFRNLVKKLIDADAQIDVFEYALQRALTQYLDHHFNDQPHRLPINYYVIQGLTQEVSIILSTLAHRGDPNAATARSAFTAAAEKLPASRNNPFVFLSATDCTWEKLDQALDKIAEGTPNIKKWVLGAALTCLMHDHEIRIEEAELFRAIAGSLDCPVPPWLAPGIQR